MNSHLKESKQWYFLFIKFEIIRKIHFRKICWPVNGRSRKLLNSQTPKLFGERLDAINIFRARKLPSWLFFFRMYSDGADHS